jgi:hypothetical protein
MKGSLERLFKGVCIFSKIGKVALEEHFWKDNW